VLGSRLVIETKVLASTVSAYAKILSGLLAWQLTALMGAQK